MPSIFNRKCSICSPKKWRNAKSPTSKACGGRSNTPESVCLGLQRVPLRSVTAAGTGVGLFQDAFDCVTAAVWDQPRTVFRGPPRAPLRSVSAASWYVFNGLRSLMPAMVNRLLRNIRFEFERDRTDSYLCRWLFLRLLGIVYLIALVSLCTQIDGLAGHNGILPVVDYLEAVRERIGAERYWRLPTFCWLGAGDGFLHFQCAAGTVLSLLLIVGIAPVPALVFLWAIYLSLSTVCRDFLSFQWDILLLETGFLAIFLAPRQWLANSSRESAPSVIVLWLCRWLLFRLMFMSGAVKLLSADRAWWDLSALTFHYETQPLPTWVGWYAHQLPVWFQKISVAIMFGIELAAPFLILCGRRPRQIACGAFALLMLLISLTGNYCFFNLLTVALCVLLLDDAFLLRLLPASVAAFARTRLSSPAESAPQPREAGQSAPASCSAGPCSRPTNPPAAPPEAGSRPAAAPVMFPSWEGSGMGLRVAVRTAALS